MAAKLINVFLDDPLLMAFDALPSNKLLVQEQVALLLECMTRWLEEQRSRGAPPPYVQLGKRMIRYAAGPLRDWAIQTIETASDNHKVLGRSNDGNCILKNRHSISPRFRPG